LSGHCKTSCSEWLCVTHTNDARMVKNVKSKVTVDVCVRGMNMSRFRRVSNAKPGRRTLIRQSYHTVDLSRNRGAIKASYIDGNAVVPATGFFSQIMMISLAGNLM